MLGYRYEVAMEQDKELMEEDMELDETDMERAKRLEDTGSIHNS